MRLIWTTRAKRNLRDIVSYIWTDNPAAARKIKARVEKQVAFLAHQPFMGRPGAIAGTREAIAHPSYRVIYQVTGETVSILAILHTRRQWPPVSED